jgi:hypothetical protein
MAFLIKRNKTMPKILKEATFETYESARSAARTYIRKNYECAPGENPSISVGGFRIEAVQQQVSA